MYKKETIIVVLSILSLVRTSFVFPDEKLNLRKIQSFTSVSDGEFNDLAVKKHNELRALHGAPPLESHPGLVGMAKAYAQKMASNGQFKHSDFYSRKLDGFKYVGENLFWSKGFRPQPDAAYVCQSWYDEIKDYNFSTHRSNGGVVGHFTQLIWKATTKVGCAYAIRGDEFYGVCNYAEMGNWQGQNAANVLPLL